MDLGLLANTHLVFDLSSQDVAYSVLVSNKMPVRVRSRLLNYWFVCVCVCVVLCSEFGIECIQECVSKSVGTTSELLHLPYLGRMAPQELTTKDDFFFYFAYGSNLLDERIHVQVIIFAFTF